MYQLQYVCLICGQAFLLRSSYDRHMRGDFKNELKGFIAQAEIKNALYSQQRRERRRALGIPDTAGRSISKGG